MIKRYPVEFLTTSSAMELCFYDWVPVLLLYCHARVQTGKQRNTQDTCQCANKCKKEKDCNLVYMDVNNASFFLNMTNLTLQMFNEKENVFNTLASPQSVFSFFGQFLQILIVII